MECSVYTHYLAYRRGRYAGILQMTEYPAAKWTTNSYCRSNDFKKLFHLRRQTYPFIREEYDIHTIGQRNEGRR